MFTLGVVGSFFFMLLPLIVDALVGGGAPQRTAGFVGSAPLAGMFVGSVACAAALPRLRWRGVSWLALCTLAGANAASAYAIDAVGALMALQFAAGFAGVVLMSVTFAFISRHAAPDRYFALFIALQMAAGALATLFVERVVIDTGAAGIFAFLAVCAVVAIPIVWLAPQGPEHSAARSTGLSDAARLVASPGGLAVLATQVIFGAGIMLIWSYAARIGAGHGLPPALVAQALAYALLSSIVGALAASATGRRIRVEASLALGSGLMVAAAALATSVQSPAGFFVAIALFGFGWNFLPPFQLGIAADLDPTGRLVVLNIALVKLGYAIGTASAGMLASMRAGHALHALAASACFFAALLTALAAKRSSRARGRECR